MMNKLLLTSAGLTNTSLVKALERLSVKPLRECRSVFIPTAANVEHGSKDWLIENYNQCINCNFAEFDILDIAALESRQALARIETSDIIFVGGGNTAYLYEQIVRSGLTDAIQNYSEKVWVGISAGSMVCTPMLRSIHSTLYYEKENDDVPALNLVPFYLLPHYNSTYFTDVCDANLDAHFTTSTDTTYTLDDQSGILVDSETVEVISEGKWRKFH
jgi:dipeptidase E